MTSSTILVHFPFPLSQIDSATIGVCYETKIFEIIRGCLLQQSRPDLNPCDYCLIIHPQDAVLLPFASVNDYRKSFLMNNQVSFYLIPKMYFTVRLNVISVQVTTLCDCNQSISDLLAQIKNASQINKSNTLLSKDNNLLHVNSSYISDPNCLVAYIKGQPVRINTRLNDIFRQNNYKTPVISIKRQNSTPFLNDNTICPVFKNTLEAALVRDRNSAKIPFFLTKIFELVEKSRDTVGIYRKSGDSKIIDTISKKIDTTSDKSQLSSYLEQQTPHELACTVKLYLRQLTEALIPPCLAKSFYSVLTIGEAVSRRDSAGPIPNLECDIDDEMVKFMRNKIQTQPMTKQSSSISETSNEIPEEKMAKKLTSLKALLRALTKPSYDLLEALCEHMEKIVEASTANQMNYKNLSICIGTNIVRVAQGIDTVKETSDAQSICQLIFENWRQLFVSNPTVEVKREVNDEKTYKVTKVTNAYPYILNQPTMPQSTALTGSTSPPVSNLSLASSSQGSFSSSNPSMNPNSNPVPVPPPPSKIIPIGQCNIFNQNVQSEAGAKLTPRSSGGSGRMPTMNPTNDTNFVIKPNQTLGFNPEAISHNMTSNGRMMNLGINNAELSETASSSSIDSTSSSPQSQGMQRKISNSSSFNTRTNRVVGANLVATTDSQFEKQYQQPMMPKSLQPLTKMQPFQAPGHPKITSSSSFNVRTSNNQRRTFNNRDTNQGDQQQPSTVTPGSTVTLIEKMNTPIEGMFGPAWIVEYNGSLVKIDSSALSQKVEEKCDPSLILPEPSTIEPLNPFGTISLTSLSKRNFLQPDDVASQIALNGPDACYVVEKLKAIEAKLNTITEEYNNNGRSRESCAKVRKLLRQLSSF